MAGKLHLIATINESGGFCFGVVTAIQKAEEALRQNQKVYCLGQIVHNDEEVERLEALGLITITHNDLPAIRNSIILFRAHGEPASTYALAESNNNQVIDATCPIILNIQKKVAGADQRGEFIMIFGKHNHPEVISLAGQCKQKPLIFENKTQLVREKLPKNVTLFSQTTMSLKEFNEILSLLKSKGIEVKVFDTICRYVHNREDEIFSFCKRFNKIVFIAGRNSSNGKVLFSRCREANPAAYFVASANEVRKEWFVEGEHVGICGGTSTPRWQMEKVKQIIEGF